MDNGIDIGEITEVTEEVVQAFERLIPQLSSSCLPPTRAELQEMASSDVCALLVARDLENGGEIAGTLTLVAFRIPTGVRAWIEDVVVDAKARRRGIGEALIRAAIQCAANLGAKTVDLTSRPSREAANRLYRRVGFVQRETNIYRYTLE